MKHRTREAIFNLISTAAKERHAIDLFAGTGALGLEALSRGAVGATFIEKHVPTARTVEQNIATLGVGKHSSLLTTSAFLWGKRDLPQWSVAAGDGSTAAPANASVPPLTHSQPWLVFCSPPYIFFVDREAEMIELIDSIMEHSPPDSVVVVEADERFDFSHLPGGVAERRDGSGWQVREYPPAVVGVWQKPAGEST